MSVKLLGRRHRKVSSGSKNGNSSITKVATDTQDVSGADSLGETMILVMSPSKRDRYWEHRNEKMGQQLSDMGHEINRYRSRLEELKSIHAQAPPRERSEVRREIEETQRAIRRSRAGSVLIRTHLQVTDDKDPGEVTAQFLSINRDIDNLCRDINEDLANLCVLDTDAAIKSSLDVRDMIGVERALYGSYGANPSLIESASGAGRPIAEFMDFALQFLINKELHVHIFHPFNPLMSASDNECISRMYELVRRRDPQVISGGWRASTFASGQSTISPATVQRWLDSLRTGLVNNILLPFLTAVYGGAAYIPSKHEQALASIISKAYKWNQMAKTEVLLLDFQPIMFPHSVSFDPASMMLIDRTHPPPDAEPILSTVSLGLRSSEALGGGVLPKYVWQKKAVVLTDGYFES